MGRCRKVKEKNPKSQRDLLDSDDEVATPSRCSKKRKVLSDSDSDESTHLTVSTRTLRPSNDQETPGRKNKIRRCVDSSDEENHELETRMPLSAVTPKAAREQKLKEMKRRVQAKKGLYNSSEEEEEEERGSEMNSEDEDNLPMFENEDELPDDALAYPADGGQDHSDLDDFVVNDDVVEMEENASGSEEEGSGKEPNTEAKVKRKGKAKSKKGKQKKKIEYSEEEANTDDDYDYANPYKAMDDEFEESDIMDILSKSTAKDKKNAKMYKKEMGKYQFSVRSDRNMAAKISNKARFAMNMDKVKTDRGFKAERNLDCQDEEYHDYVETSLYGEGVRIFPHTKKISKYSVKCALVGCGEFFTAGESRIVGATKFSDINLMYLKKTNRFGKESYYYICYKHLPEDYSSDEYQSDVE